MSIIVTNQSVNANISYKKGCLDIAFRDDPSYTRSETVVIDLMRRNIGLIFQDAYHHVGSFPDGFTGREADVKPYARLHGDGERGQKIELHAPVTIAAH